MLYYNFKDYEGFKELFGIRECGNGVKTRQNKILLSWIKQNHLLKKAIEGEKFALDCINFTDMTTLLNHLRDMLWQKGRLELDMWSRCRIVLMDGWDMYSLKYRLDSYNGVCEDKDYRSIRYVNLENGRVFKMKAGKFLKAVMLETEWGRSVPEPVLLWLCEQFTQMWETYTRSVLPDYELHVGYDFDLIYDSNKLKGDFHSCMTDEEYHYFYSDYVKARAAYLTDNDGYIIARCVIFDECHIMEGELKGKVLRLAERQYSTDCCDVLKRCLVDALIKAGEIDGYKKVGADCHSGHSFELNDGSPMRSDMWIKCTAKDGDTCSYMDSFVWLDTRTGKAYNSDRYDFNAELDTTGGEVEANEGENYDSWHDYYTNNDIIDVYHNGVHYTCDEDNRDGFVWVEEDQEYWYEDDVNTCPNCGEYYVIGHHVHSSITGDDYCCDDCREQGERDWLDENGTYSEYDDENYLDDEVKTFVNADGNEMTIHIDSLQDLIDSNSVHYDYGAEMWSAYEHENENA